jgi:ferredoxin-nitrite reductase
MSTDPGFSEEQKQYLQGFASGLAAKRAAAGLPALFDGGAKPSAPVPSSPDGLHRAAQDRFLTAGKKLSAEEEAKRTKNPLDMWDELVANAAAGRFPKGTDVFLTKFHGLFYVAPAQNAFMCRLRIPNGILTSLQCRGVADLAERHGGGYVDITTRANLQFREIRATDTIAVLTGLQDLGLTSRGSGADNIRNITGSPTAGIDPDELIDTRPLARALHYHILNHREMYGLPRKFNVAFDGGGRIAVLEDTNDIGFAAVAVGEGQTVPAGVYFRLQLGGITGHGDFARDAGVVLAPEECIPTAAAIVRVFLDHGDRTDRRKARLKYVLDGWGLEKFLADVEKHLPSKLRRLPLEACAPRAPIDKHGHIGIHRQRQEGFCYIGVVVPVGRLTVAQMRGLADIAERYGAATLRLTVWQNLLISDIPEADLDAVKEALAALDLAWSTTSIRGGLVACTGNTGCKFAATNTKGQALALAEYLERRVALDQPINIHLTGCPHSCAQHYVGDIGLLGAKVEAGDDTIEGYHIYVGGGAGGERGLGREIARAVPFAEVPERLARLLETYLRHRRGPGEPFHAFARRHSIEELRALCGQAPAEAA